MRKRTKREILALLDTVNEALFHLLTAKEVAAGSLLSDCCAAMAAIGRSFAEDGDAHALLRRKLKRFAAALEKAAQRRDALRQAEVLALAEELKPLRRKIAGMRTKLEIVFLPYKASMWDSLESIWRAAAADPDCDAYVVPIPYYDLHPDHTAAKFHYEGGLYPEDVPITDYRAYDLATRRPDVIYIHNPYDGCNRVTSVDPAYYSERLKQYTDMLVYVPYFVVTGDKISEHFCQTPGVYHADRVIVQSEAIKKTYAKFVPAEKILVLGSPKFDKVAWMMAHPPAMPREWAEIARGRKLVLYNTHLSPLIVDARSVCKKIEYIFSVFKKRKDVCLLWRPHPLSIPTLKAMGPEKLQEYLEIISIYKKEKIGIYDTSIDVHRAIVLSSMYYGDVSSLIPLYAMTKKPIFIQNLKLLNRESEIEYRTFSFMDAALNENALYFPSTLFNGLFKMDLLKDTISFLGRFPGETQEKNLYSRVVKTEKYLYFIPYMATYLAEYDIENNIFQTYEVEKYIKKDSLPYKFIEAFYRDDYLWLIPGKAQCILRFHIISKKIENVFDLRKCMEISIDSEDLIFTSAVMVDQSIWCLFPEGNLIFEFNIKEKIYKIHTIGTVKRSYYKMIYAEGVFWLLFRDQPAILSWEMEKNQIKEYKDIPSVIVSEAYSLGSIFYFNKKLWILPCYGDFIVTFDIEYEKFDIYDQMPAGIQYLEKIRTRQKCWGARIWGRNLYIFPWQGNALCIIDLNKKKCLDRKVRYNNSLLNKIGKYIFSDRTNEKFDAGLFSYRVYIENYPLVDFLDTCNIDEEFKEEKRHEEYGAKIYTYIKSHFFVNFNENR